MTGSKRFAILISLMSTLAFFFSTGIPTLIDPQIEPLRSDIYGIHADYPLGLWVLFLGLPVGFITFVLNIKISRNLIKTVLTGLTSALGGIFVLPNFQPFPHLFVLGTSLTYGFTLSLIVFCQNYEFSIRYRDTSIAERARIERVRLEYETWFRGLIIFTSFMVASFGIIVLSAFESGIRMHSVHGEITEEVLKAALHFHNAMWIGALYFGVLNVWLLWIILRKISEISDLLYEIKK